MPDHIHLPVALCTGLLPGGMTAPALRMALVLIAAANTAGEIDVLKPQLEKRAGVRLDNAHRSLERLRISTTDLDEQEVLTFQELDYFPGVQKRLAGVIRGKLSPALIAALADPRHVGAKVTVDVQELRRLNTLPGICLWLRLAVERQAGAERIDLRLRDVDAVGVFGPYIGRAAITRSNADGEPFRATSLSRVYDELVAPGVADLWPALDGYVVDARPGVPVVRQRGRAWSHIDVTFSKLQKRLSVRELAAAQKAQEAYDERKHERSIKSNETDP